jgi:hypothetical protein
MKRALFALLAFFVVGSALGQSPESTKIRITTWNLERSNQFAVNRCFTFPKRNQLFVACTTCLHQSSLVDWRRPARGVAFRKRSSLRREESRKAPVSKRELRNAPELGNDRTAMELKVTWMASNVM